MENTVTQEEKVALRGISFPPSMTNPFITLADLLKMIEDGLLPGGSEAPPQYLFVAANGIQYRIGVRGAILVKDATLTPLGFKGEKDVDWENVEGE